MKICLILEGSYPHVTGGVSTWAQQLIQNMPEHQFMIFAIGAEEKLRGIYKYELPENVVSVKEVFLDEMLKENGRYGKTYRLGRDTVINLKKLITGERVQWEPIFKFWADRKIKSEMDFFMSINFFDILKDAYEEKYKSVPFTEFFWTVRSMLVPLFFLLKNRLPKADIYHSAATGYAGIFGSMAKYLYKSPFLVTEHGIYSREREEEIIKSSWVKSYFKDMWIKFFYNICGGVYIYADKVMTLFEKNRQIQVELGCPERKLEIVPNGIDVSAFIKFGLQDEEKKASLPVKDDYVNIGTITRVVPIKDIKTMIQSFSLIKNNIKKTRFFIMGPKDEDEEYYKECIRLINRLGLKDIEFTGRVDVKDRIGDLDILVLTSISEGQPFAILEGMAAKKPFVTTDVGGCTELLYGRNDNFGQAGIVVPVMDIEKIAKAIASLVHDEDTRKTMGSNGFNRVSALYTYEECVEKYRNIYKRFGTGQKALWQELVLN